MGDNCATSAAVTAHVLAAKAAATRELESVTPLVAAAVTTRMNMRATSQDAAQFRGFVDDVSSWLAALEDKGNPKGWNTGTKWDAALSRIRGFALARRSHEGCDSPLLQNYKPFEYYTFSSSCEDYFRDREIRAASAIGARQREPNTYTDVSWRNCNVAGSW